MARRKKSNPVTSLLIFVAFVVIFSIPIQVWVWLAVVGVLAGGVYFLQKPKKADVKSEDESSLSRSKKSSWRSEHSVQPSHANSKPVTKDVDESYFVKSSKGESVKSSAFRIPKAPKGFSKGEWIDLGQTFEIAGIKISGGMVYLG